MFNNSSIGILGEKIANEYLSKNKYLKLLLKNFETDFGEIDLIYLQNKKSCKKQIKKLKNKLVCVDEFEKCELIKQINQKQFECLQTQLVFVEVKLRSYKSSCIASPNEAVDLLKQTKYKKLAEVFCKINKFDFPRRFDIVEIICKNGKYFCRHIENAF